MSTTKRPSLLSKTRTVAAAIRSPCGEYFAAVTQPSWCGRQTTRLRVAMSQTAAVVLQKDATTSRVESGEKSTALTVLWSFLCVKTFWHVFASHIISSPPRVPAAIHLPSFETARHRTSFATIIATGSPSSTCHTRIPWSSPLTRCLPFAENSTASIR